MEDIIIKGKIRLYVTDSLVCGKNCVLSSEQLHYLRHVMRCEIGDYIQVFNGLEGQWQSQIIELSKKKAVLTLQKQILPQLPCASDIWLLFSPIKSGRMEYLVQKATEMGVSKMIPILTEYTQMNKLNYKRLQANIVEAAEQCGGLFVPIIEESIKLEQLIRSWKSFSPQRQIIFCDEKANMDNTLSYVDEETALLIGPEGGFSDKERQMLLQCDTVTRMSLGSRVLRSDTAVVSGLTLLQHACVKSETGL